MALLKYRLLVELVKYQANMMIGTRLKIKEMIQLLIWTGKLLINGNSFLMRKFWSPHHIKIFQNLKLLMPN